jgi:hypothetical protein
MNTRRALLMSSGILSLSVAGAAAGLLARRARRAARAALESAARFSEADLLLDLRRLV